MDLNYCFTGFEPIRTNGLIVARRLLPLLSTKHKDIIIN